MPCPTFEQVLLARHGRTVWNAEGRLQGQLDSALSADGDDLLAATLTLLTEQGVDAVFTSPLGRARATARFFGRGLGLAVTEVAELSEVHHGRYAGLTRAEIERAFPGELGRRVEHKYTWRFPEGESYADADVRAGVALQVVASHDSRRPLIVSHEMIGLMLVRNLLDLDPEAALAMTHPHDVVYRMDGRTGELTALTCQTQRPR